MQVVEIFKSIQGEGTLIGAPMVFIRLWGCNMQCTWCDTTYAWAPEFKDVTKRMVYTPEELATHLLEKYPDIKWFNFTGGEPSLWAQEIIKTTETLQNHSKSVCIQTNGKIWNTILFSNLDKVCMDIKCPDSGEKSDLESIKKLREQDEIKFVLGSNTDVNYAKNVIKSYPTRSTIIIQPVMLKNEHLENYYEKIKWLISEFDSIEVNNVRILPQLHQLLWRDQAGK